jgi:5-methylthioadenosine/S-adenosylhomocysteine deaminase
MRTLLRNGTLITMNAKKQILEHCEVLLDDDRIGGIFPAGAENNIRADKVLDCKDKIIMPGMVSGHSHLTGIFQRGLWNEPTFEGWIAKSNAIERLVDLSAEDIYALHSAACIEFLRHGVTTVLNMFAVRPVLDLEKIDASRRAFMDTGVRGILAVALQDRSTNGEPQPGPFADKGWMSAIRDAFERVTNSTSRVGFMLAPGAPQWCSDQLLIPCRELAEELGIGIHTHLLETKGNAEAGRRLHGEPILPHLEKIGFLSGRLSVAHCNWLENEDIDKLAKHDVKVVHNPSANMKLGSGFARVKRMRRTGLTLGLGADSVNAGTVYSVFEQMKLAVLGPRILWGAENWVLPEEAFEMATLGGAKAMLLDEVVGSIEEGKKADLVVLNPKISLLPTNDIINQIALGENGESVESVFVDGTPVLLNGRVEAVNETDILAALASLAPRIRQARNEVLRLDAKAS